ncbi:MAG: hypothetical protein K8S87_07355 [Planctomycetes bacterium]|nr:hypothetical protein [Planctomycetota bacterium]
MRNSLIVFLFILNILFAVSCGNDDETKTLQTTNSVAKPLSEAGKALLIIDNYTTGERKLYKITTDWKRIQIGTLKPFDIIELTIDVGTRIFEIMPNEGVLSNEIRIDAKKDTVYVWDLSGKSNYVKILFSTDGMNRDRVFKGAERGLYVMNVQLSMLQPIGELVTSVYKVFKEIPDDEPITIEYAKKIAFETPSAFTFETQQKAVVTLAEDFEGKELEKRILPLFEQDLATIYVPAAELLAKRGSKELGEIYLQKLLKGWARNHPLLKVSLAVQIIAGCAGIEAFNKLWQANDEEGKNLMFTALLRTDLDASIEFMLDILDQKPNRFQPEAFKYLILTNFIHKPGVYNKVRDFAEAFERKNPKYLILKEVIANASSVLSKFPKEEQLLVLLGNLQYPDMNMIRFGLQNIVHNHDEDGLKALTEEYISLTTQIRKEAVNHVIFRYRKEPVTEVLVNFLKLVASEDSIDERWTVLKMLASPQMLNFDKKLFGFLSELMKSEPVKTQAKLKATIDEGYAKFLMQVDFTDDVKAELKKLIVTGAVDASIHAYNYLKQKLEKQEFQEYLHELKTKFGEFPVNNKCVLLDKFAKEFEKNEAKQILLEALKEKSYMVRTVAFDRLIKNPEYSKDDDVASALAKTADSEQNADTKKYFDRTITLTRLNSLIFEGVSTELLAIVDANLGSTDEILVQKTIEIIQGMEGVELQRLLIKHFSKFSEAQRVQVTNYMTGYEKVDFEWLDKTAKDNSLKVRNALFIALANRFKIQKDEKALHLCSKMAENETDSLLSARFKQKLSEISAE